MFTIFEVLLDNEKYFSPGDSLSTLLKDVLKNLQNDDLDEESLSLVQAAKGNYTYYQPKEGIET